MGDAMNYLMWSTAVLTVWAALGPLLGVRYGQHLAHRYQRERWIADSKKKEFKELFGVLDGVFAFYVRERLMPSDKKAPQSEYLDLNHKATWCIRDRLFIVKEMEEHKVLDRWRTLMNEFLANEEFHTFKTKFNKLREDLMDAATKDIKSYTAEPLNEEIEKADSLNRADFAAHPPFSENARS